MSLRKRYVVVAVVALIAAGLAVALSYPYWKRAAVAYRRGRDALESGNTDLAFSWLEEAIRLNPEDYRAHEARARTYMIKNEEQLALRDVSEAIRINPDFAPAYQTRSRIYELFYKNDYLVEADLSTAIRLAPLDSPLFYQRGIFRMKHGNFTGAAEDFVRVLTLGSDHTDDVKAWLEQARVSGKRAQQLAANTAASESGQRVVAMLNTLIAFELGELGNARAKMNKPVFDRANKALQVLANAESEPVIQAAIESAQRLVDEESKEGAPAAPLLREVKIHWKPDNSARQK